MKTGELGEAGKKSFHSINGAKAINEWNIWKVANYLLFYWIEKENEAKIIILIIMGHMD